MILYRIIWDIYHTIRIVFVRGAVGHLAHNDSYSLSCDCPTSNPSKHTKVLAKAARHATQAHMPSLIGGMHQGFHSTEGGALLWRARIPTLVAP